MLIPTKKTQMIDSVEDNFSLSFEQLLELPGNVFWKNREGIYLGYNNFGAEMLGFHEGSELIGKNDLDIFLKPVARLYRKNDEFVMHQNKQISFSEKGFIKNKIPVIFLSYKTPIFNKNKILLGVFGISYTQLQNEIQLQIPNQTLVEKDPIHLTEREKICVSLLCHSLTAKHIAKKIGISFRTVQTYLERSKEKLYCQNKAELIAAFLKKYEK